MAHAVLIFATGPTIDDVAQKVRAAAAAAEDHHEPGVITGNGWWADIHETTTDATEEQAWCDR